MPSRASNNPFVAYPLPAYRSSTFLRYRGARDSTRLKKAIYPVSGDRSCAGACMPGPP
ncbi:hypothetical protein SVAN01_08371 [Stagonosporopsis vannaccii]|nr:hypothetical protein SVAN01_08371 [Stagonosporopsis vannaccii]